jgi:capsular exopolysaccharide synthesis family protein
MDLHSLLSLVRRRALHIILATLVCAGAALLASVRATPVYQAEAKLLLVARSETGTTAGGGISTAYEGALLSQQLTRSFAEIMQSRGTAEATLARTGYPMTASELQQHIHAEAIPETLLISLSVTDTDARRVQRLTADVARTFVTQLPRLQGGSAVRAAIVEAPLRPTKPISPKTTVNIALGLILGLALGLAIAFVTEQLDTSVKTSQVLEEGVGAPVIGVIPKFDKDDQLPVANRPGSIPAEAFRKMRTNFSFLSVDRKSLCCVITSPVGGDGKSTVAGNLAVALAEAGQRVALIDCDLRKPTLHKVFGQQDRVGVTSILLEQATVEDAAEFHCGGLLAVITAGLLPPNPSELLGSRRMSDLIRQLRELADIVLIDCPPVLPVTDPMVVSRWADGALLVVRSGVTSKDQLKAARQACAQGGATVLGTALNGASEGADGRTGYYSYYGEPSRATEAAIEIEEPGPRSRIHVG